MSEPPKEQAPPGAGPKDPALATHWRQRLAACGPVLQRTLAPLRARLNKIPAAAAAFRTTVSGKTPPPRGAVRNALDRFLTTRGPALAQTLHSLLARLAALLDSLLSAAAARFRRGRETGRESTLPAAPAKPGPLPILLVRAPDPHTPAPGRRLHPLLARPALVLDATGTFLAAVLGGEKRPARLPGPGPGGTLFKFFKYLGVSWGSVLQHKLRSFLTVLGIIFGVAAVIAMTAIGEGGKEAALKQIQEMGINNIYINDLSPVRRSVHEKGGYVSQGISDADLRFIRAAVPSISSAARLKDKELYVHAEGFEGVVPVRGTDAEAFAILGLATGDGRILSPLDCAESAKTCVLGAEIARELFQQTGAVGAFLRIADQHYQVAGVLEPKPGFGRVILLPFSSRVLHEGIEEYEAAVSSAVFYIPDLTVIAPTEQLIRRILLRRHYDVADFEIVVPEALLRQQERTQNLFNMIMILITGISLLVGGIGIMNIMLASVMERTKEIGIRRGMGATRLDIQQQFLAEAVTLTSAGGIIGVLFGLLLTLLIALLTGWNIRISPVSIGIAFSFSVFIGVAFGYYPARNASNLNPIDALRYE